MHDTTIEKELAEALSSRDPGGISYVSRASLRRHPIGYDGRDIEPGPSNSATMEEQPTSARAELAERASPDYVNHPPHYTAHPSGVECITITEWMNFNLGNAMKYIWRSGDKGATIEDLKKARWYLDREIDRLGRI